MRHRPWARVLERERERFKKEQIEHYLQGMSDQCEKDRVRGLQRNGHYDHCELVYNAQRIASNLLWGPDPEYDAEYVADHGPLDSIRCSCR
jgi:hypothetical protein